jgi:hypothetical protein
MSFGAVGAVQREPSIAVNLPIHVSFDGGLK